MCENKDLAQIEVQKLHLKLNLNLISLKIIIIFNRECDNFVAVPCGFEFGKMQVFFEF